MPTYFFDFHDTGEGFPDEIGNELDDIEAAKGRSGSVLDGNGGGGPARGHSPGADHYGQ